jgi:hypothetical protein
LCRIPGTFKTYQNVPAPTTPIACVITSDHEHDRVTMRLKFRPDHALLDGFDSFSGLRKCVRRKKGESTEAALRKCVENSYNKQRAAQRRGRK